MNVLGRPMPRHEFVDAGLGPPADKARQHIGEVALRIHKVQLACFDERCHAGPTRAAFVRAGAIVLGF